MDYFRIQLQGHSPSLREVRRGTEAGAEVETLEGHCLLACS